jgi:hypothetical protein
MGSPTLENTSPTPSDSTGIKPSNTPRYAQESTLATTLESDTKTAGTVPLQQLPLNANNFAPDGQATGDAAQPATDDPYLKRFNNVPRGDATANGDTAPININDINEIPIFFVLDNRPNTAEKLTPAVGIHDPEKTTPLQITDGGRVVTTDSGLHADNWSINKNPETGDIETIKYPDGKIRNFKHENGQLTRIETIDKSVDGLPSKTVFTRDPETKKWFAEIGGLRAELPGDIQFTKDGVLSFQLDNAGKWRAERPDGSTVIERTIQSGARVAFNDDNTVQQITRPDQSRVECVREKGELVQVNELSADGKSVSWTKSGDKWVSNQNPPQERTGVEVSDNGNYSFVAADNIKHTIIGNGLELNQNPNGSSFQFDKEGRFTELKDTNGLRVHGIQYSPETGQVTRAQIGSAEGGRVHTYEREGNTNQWKYTVTDGSGNVVSQDRWSGEIAVGKDGTYAYKEDPRHGRNADGLWVVFKLDGSQYMLQDNGQGSRAIFDMNRNLLAIERQNGTKLDVIRQQGGQATQITETLRNGEQVKYTIDSMTGMYMPDNANAKPIKKLEATGNGLVQIVDGNGALHSVNMDGSSIVKNADGSMSEVDGAGRVLRTMSKDGGVSRIFQWENDKLVSVSETKKTGETRMIAGNNMSATADGTVFYTDTDGQRISTTPDGSWQAYQTINGKDYLVRAVNPKGHMRTINRDQTGEAISMVDSKPTPNGQQIIEEYNRVPENGRWSDSWAKVAKDGKITARHTVRLNDNGTYNYIDNTGKDKLAKVGDRGFEGGFSDSVDEARSRLTELMESHLDEAQKKRFQTILDRFEKRGKERVEAQVAGGLDQTKSMEEWDQKISKAYDHMSKMLDPNATGTQYDLKTRAKLVENMAFAMAAPVKANDQGNWGCCWMISGVYCGIIQYPDKMAAMLSELSMTGKYTDVNGKTWSPPANLLRFTSQGGNWTIENCGNGQRSPVSEILTSVAAYLSEDGRRLDRGASGGSGQGMNHAMKMITGDTWKVTGESQMMNQSMKQEMLTKGGYVCLMPGHMYLGALEKHGNEWKVVASMQHGDGGRRVNGTVTDLASWNVTRSRMRYNPDIDLPECKDQPIGPSPGGWADGGGGFGGRRRWLPRLFPRLFGDAGSCEYGCSDDQLIRNMRAKRAREQEEQEKLIAWKEMQEDIRESQEADGTRRIKGRPGLKKIS